MTPNLQCEMAGCALNPHLGIALNAHQMCFKCNHMIQVIHSFILARQEVLFVYLVYLHCPLAISCTSGSGMTHVVYCIGHVFVGVYVKWIGL